MAVRLPREDAVAGPLAVYAGWVTVVGALVFGAFVFVVGVDVLPLSVGLALLGAGWIVRGQHRRRRPPCYVLVEDDGVRLMPEGTRFSHDELAPLQILEWSFDRTNSAGLQQTLTRAAIKSLEPKVELYRTGDRAGCEAWLERYAAARDGAEPVPPSDLDRALETPSGAALGVVIGVTVAAVAGVVAGYVVDLPMWANGSGAGVLVMAATVAWSNIDRRGVARGLGLLGGLALFARPFIHPVMIPVVGGFDSPGPFAEMHLGFFAGGILAAIYAVVGTRPPHLVD